MYKLYHKKNLTNRCNLIARWAQKPYYGFATVGLMKCTFHCHFILPCSCLKQDEKFKRKPTNLHTGNRCRLKKRYRLTYELTEFCLLVIYNKPGVVQYIYIVGQRFLFKTSCISFSEQCICINKQ